MSITNGRVRVNGKVVTDLSTQINDRDIVELNGKVIKPVTDKIYLVMNKPRGYVTSCYDDRGRKIVMDLLPEDMRGKHIFPVGRLDYDTEGLLILTNDGDFAQGLIHPKFKVQKVYVATVDQEVTPQHIKDLSIQADRVTKTGDKVIEIIIHTGLNRQVRKMIADVGLETVNLKRVAIGDLVLRDLKVGHWRAFSLQDTKLGLR
jgi:23S rRNA pseudouridine2605 synthase